MIIIVSIESNAQISLDFQKSGRLYYFKLNNSETKYIDEGTIEFTSPDQFSLFNLDGSLYKTIQLPFKPDPTATINNVSCVSTTLFDNDPSSIEFLLNYKWYVNPTGYVEKVIVARENGVILLDEMYATTYYFRPLVYGTEEGTKLMLFYAFPDSLDYTTKVFSLPGEPPVNVDNEIDRNKNEMVIYPNPNNGSFFINFHSNDSNNNQIELYSTNGKLIDKYKSSGNPTHINSLGLSDGVYFINTRSKGVNSTTKMLIKK